MILLTIWLIGIPLTFLSMMIFYDLLQKPTQY